MSFQRMGLICLLAFLSPLVVCAQLQIKDDDTNYLTLDVPTNLTADRTYTFPDAPVNGQFLTTNGSGVLSWTNQLTNLAAPVSANDAATKAYVDAAGGGTWTDQTFTSSGTWIRPAGVDIVYVSCVGGGGGGDNGAGVSGYGGGGGGQAVVDYPALVSGNVTVTIGSAGAANGGNGGTTSFGSIVSVAGGRGGTFDGGNGGGSLNRDKNGENSVYAGHFVSGGGGGDGVNGNGASDGGNSGQYAGGAGGSGNDGGGGGGASYFGAGGNGGTTSGSAGSSGSGYGSGGGGGGNGANGGAGRAGYCYLRWQQ